jgi:hypothetical protein
MFRLFPAAAFLTAAVVCAGAVTARADIKVIVVNMIPRDQSDETNNDAEPNLAVNPANPMLIAGSAFTPNRLGGDAPIYISTDGGNTWSLNFIVPSRGTATGTGDITLRFAESGTLYVGILKLPVPINVTRLNVLRSANFTAPAQMKVLVDRKGVDQPHVSSMRVPDGPDKGKDRVFVGNNDFNGPTTQTAAIDRSLSGSADPALFQTFRLDTRQPNQGNGPQIRCAVHPTGTVYAAFYSWRDIQVLKQDAGALISGLATVDVVVVRDDNWAGGSTPFQALIDLQDSKVGRRVAQASTLPWINDFDDISFGQERLGGDLAIATDPRPDGAGTVYLSWADRVGQNDYTLHLRQSTDRGKTWSPSDLLRLTNAKNPGLAVNSQGQVGFVFQELVGTPVDNQRWHTRMQVRDSNFNLIKEFTLADTPAHSPPRDGLPYLGDYLHLMSVGKDFYGVFPASNIPDKANFPAAIPTFQRRVDFDHKQLLDEDGNPVNPSIDPFFFKVTIAD